MTDPLAEPFTPAHRGGAGEPLLLLHGFTANWRTWELVLPALEARHDVLAPTLIGHAGGPPFPPEGAGDDAIVDGVEAVMDAAGWATAHVVGNSLGGYVALRLAARGRARSVVALAPAGGWTRDDPAFPEALDYFRETQGKVRAAASRVDQIVATPEGRRRATVDYATTDAHMPSDLIRGLLLASAGCHGAAAYIEFAAREGWDLDAARVRCPVRIVWGTEDRILPLPGAGVRYRGEWFPDAEWIELPGAGHCPQLDHPAEIADLILAATSREPND
jgi:pimeloyl-ACP methyl ester carboxylesterase